jgi:hypothetical protein
MLSARVTLVPGKALIMNNGKKRGRPVGTGIDDNDILDRIADFIARDPDLKVATALKRLQRRPGEAKIHRIQAKWKESGSERLQRARNRHAASREQATSGPFHLPSTLANYIDRITAVQRVLDSPAFRLAEQLKANPVLKLAQSLRESPVLRVARALEENSAVKAARALSESPAMRLVEQQRRMAEQAIKLGRF